MTPNLRKLLKKSKILELPSFVLTAVLIICIWLDSLKLAVTVAPVLLVLVGVRYACIVARRIRFLKVKNRNSDNLFNRIKR